MDKSTIHNLIDKVIGKKGLLRIPSWWMRKVLIQIADWVQEGDDANDKKIEKVKKEVDTLKPITDTLRSDTDRLVQITSPYVLVSGTGHIVVNNETISFTNADNHRINITGPLKFTNTKTSTNNITRAKLFNTSFVILGKDLENIFSICPSLTSINLNSFDTYAVTNMSHMFYACLKLAFLDLSSFDTSAVTNMTWMFYNCKSLAFLNLSSFDTSAVTNMSYMFYSCSSLTSLDLSSFNTSAVTDMSYMFSNCSSLTSLDLSSFNTSAVTDMSYMFSNCSGLTSLILSPNFFKTSKVTSVDFLSSTKWTNNTVVTSLVTNSYNRATAGLKTMTLKLSANTKAALTDEQKATITAKGYTIA